MGNLPTPKRTRWRAPQARRPSRRSRDASLPRPLSRGRRRSSDSPRTAASSRSGSCGGRWAVAPRGEPGGGGPDAGGAPWEAGSPMGSWPGGGGLSSRWGSGGVRLSVVRPTAARWLQDGDERLLRQICANLVVLTLSCHLFKGHLDDWLARRWLPSGWGRQLCLLNRPHSSHHE